MNVPKGRALWCDKTVNWVLGRPKVSPPLAQAAGLCTLLRCDLALPLSTQSPAEAHPTAKEGLRQVKPSAFGCDETKEISRECELLQTI